MSDLYNTNDGDLYFNGDIAKADPIPMRDIFQKIRKVMESNGYEWRFYKGGARLKKFIGFPNTKELGMEIQSHVRNILVNENIVPSEQLNVVVYPTDKHSISIRISVIQGTNVYVNNLIFSLKA